QQFRVIGDCQFFRHDRPRAHSSGLHGCCAMPHRKLAVAACLPYCCGMADPLVSVIIPTFNRAQRLHVSVESVIAQTYRPIELLVIDDGSSDGTPEVFPPLEQKAREAGISTVFVRKENGGCASARNLGLESASGALIAFLDDDDRWMPDKLARQVQRITETGATACCCMTRKLIQRGELIQPPTP